MRRHAAAFYARATAAGHDLCPDQSLGWLTRYGHLQAEVRARLPRSVQHALDSVFAELGGDERALRGKTRGAMTVDFLLRRDAHVVEHDERSHFTTARLTTFAYYPPDTLLGYDLQGYQDLCELHRARGYRGFAHKTATEFPGTGGRARQRAYFDAFRDLSAPALQGRPLLRVANPEENPDVALDRFEACLAVIAT
jgi:hypothetical protein